MKTVTMQGEIGTDGKLRLEVPCDLPPGPAEVVVIVQPKGTRSVPPYDTLSGLFAGKLPTAIDVEADLREMNEEWEKSLELPG